MHCNCHTIPTKSVGQQNRIRNRKVIAEIEMFRKSLRFLEVYLHRVYAAGDTFNYQPQLYYFRG